MTTSTEIGGCYTVAVEAARAAGRLLIDSLGKLQQSQVQSKGISDYVTDLDRAAERIILQMIGKRFPDHGVLAEESGQINPRSPYRWVIDPLDGTTNYIHQFPAFCVSIGLSRDNEMQVGVIYDPLRDELFHAVRGQGAFCNQAAIHVASRMQLGDALLATGFPYRISDRLEPYLQSFRAVFLNTSGIRRAGSAAIDLAYTACGRIDGFWEMGLSAWDIAAGMLIVEEAGGKVSDFAGGTGHLQHGSILASNPALHAQMVDLLKPIFPQGR